MSTIDKDKKTKLSAPSGNRFILGIKDGEGKVNPAMLTVLFRHRRLRRSK